MQKSRERNQDLLEILVNICLYTMMLMMILLIIVMGVESLGLISAETMHAAFVQFAGPFLSLAATLCVLFVIDQIRKDR